MYSPKPGNWPSQHLYLKINNGFHSRENLFEETIFESSQIKELGEPRKLLNKEVTFSDASFSKKAFICTTMMLPR